MFLNRFRSLFAEDLPTAVWWPSSPEGRVCGQRTTVTVVPYLTHNKYMDVPLLYCYTISHIYGVLHSLPLIQIFHTMHIWDTVIISIMANIYCCTIYGQTLCIISTFIVVPYHTHMEVIVFMWPISIAIFRGTITWYLPTWNCPKKALLL